MQSNAGVLCALSGAASGDFYFMVFVLRAVRFLSMTQVSQSPCGIFLDGGTHAQTYHNQLRGHRG